MNIWQRIRAWSAQRRTYQHGRHGRPPHDVRLKELVRCQGEDCNMLVPAATIHIACGRAAGYPLLIRATKHGKPCCPGICRRCGGCLERKIGWCVRCITCKACCPGHYRELVSSVDKSA